MERELSPLYKQFCAANGIKNEFSLEIAGDFNAWMKEMQHVIGPKYLEYLDYLGLGCYASYQTAEVGKGFYDSLVLSDEFGTAMISPPSVAANIRGLRKLLLSNLVICEGTPYLLGSDHQAKLTYGDPFYNLMTQNPYTEESTYGWEGLHNRYGFGIIIGVFGKNTDKDKIAKLKTIEKIPDDILDEPTTGYVEDGQYYFGVVGTKHMTLGRGLRP